MGWGSLVVGFVIFAIIVSFGMKWFWPYDKGPKLYDQDEWEDEYDPKDWREEEL